MATFTCNYCGRTSLGSGSQNKFGPTGWKNKGSHWKPYWVCSTKCENDYLGSPQMESVRQKSAEDANLKAEKLKLEYEEQRERRQRLAEEEKQRAIDRKIQAERLRSEGKPFSAALIENYNISTVVGVVYLAIWFWSMLLLRNGFAKILVAGILVAIGLGFITFWLSDFYKIDKIKQKKYLILTTLIPIIIFLGVGLFVHFTKPKYNKSQLELSLEKQMEKEMEGFTESIPSSTNSDISETKKVEDETFNAENNSILDQNTSSTSQSNPIGVWKGNFGNDEILINLDKINDDGSIEGYNEVKNNKRSLTGFKLSESEYELKEPGDNKWDGVFIVSVNGNEMKGTWKANNGKSTKEFILNKQN